MFTKLRGNSYKLDKVGSQVIYKPRKIFWWSLAIIVAVLLIFSFIIIPVNKAVGLFVWDDETTNIIGSLFKWNEIGWEDGFFKEVMKSIWETFSLALTGTVIGVIITIPLAVLASSNIIRNKFINGIVKVFFIFFRTMPLFFFVTVLMFFMATGSYGSKVLITVLASTCFTISIASKMFIDKIEQARMNTFNLLVSMGVDKTTAFKKTVFPEIAHFTVSAILYSLETNIRYLSIIAMGLGIGLGHIIQFNMIELNKVPEAGFCIFVLIVLVLLIELVSYIIRNFIIVKKDKPIHFDNVEKGNEVNYVLEKPQYGFLKPLALALLVFGVIFYVFSQFDFVKQDAKNIETGWKNLGDIFNPAWSLIFGHVDQDGHIMVYSSFEIVTEAVMIAAMGTLFGMIIAIILGALSSNTVSGKYFSKPFWFLTTIMRPTPGYIIAIFLVTLVGLSPFTGVIAIAFATSAMLSKYIRETFDQIDMKIVDNLRAMGLNKWDVFKFGILTQVRSEVVSWTLYRFDINIREVSSFATVGAGQMGIAMSTFISNSTFRNLSSILLTLMITCVVMEYIVTALRKKILLDQNHWIYNKLASLYRTHVVNKFIANYVVKNNGTAYDKSWYILKSEFLYDKKVICDYMVDGELSFEDKEVSVDLEKLNQQVIKLTKEYENYTNAMIKKINPEFHTVVEPWLFDEKYITDKKLIELKGVGYRFGIIEKDEQLTSDSLMSILVLVKRIHLERTHIETELKFKQKQRLIDRKDSIIRIKKVYKETKIFNKEKLKDKEINFIEYLSKNILANREKSDAIHKIGRKRQKNRY
ncbi:phosphonate transport system permease protein [Spiroplasma sp. TIUS-1]|uniref:PhnE/PtxC family ABC transporter permease n=1 Tax=Spiroplasma sp. TIUS-1 TaxID=216963 RepID=UPI00139794B0|nr:ABC transporter permease subunit [Spiroplasma sp. TIUS-1]QHX36200.1 phosphonate transport system permease protein [Spiroplasma sp. TIUS-1]